MGGAFDHLRDHLVSAWKHLPQDQKRSVSGASWWQPTPAPLSDTFGSILCHLLRSLSSSHQLGTVPRLYIRSSGAMVLD